MGDGYDGIHAEVNSRFFQATLSVSESSILRDGWTTSGAGKSGAFSDPLSSSSLAFSRDMCPQLSRGDLPPPSDPMLASIQYYLMAFSKTSLGKVTPTSGSRRRMGSSKSRRRAVSDELRGRSLSPDVKAGRLLSARGRQPEEPIILGEKTHRNFTVPGSYPDLNLIRKTAAVAFAYPSSVHLANISGMREEMLRMGSPTHLTHAILKASEMLLGTGRLLACTQDPELIKVRDWLVSCVIHPV